jgi:hypothetical protein
MLGRGIYAVAGRVIPANHADAGGVKVVHYFSNETIFLTVRRKSGCHWHCENEKKTSLQWREKRDPIVLKFQYAWDVGCNDFWSGVGNRFVRKTKCPSNKVRTVYNVSCGPARVDTKRYRRYSSCCLE